MLAPRTALPKQHVVPFLHLSSSEDSVTGSSFRRGSAEEHDPPLLLPFFSFFSSIPSFEQPSPAASQLSSPPLSSLSTCRDFLWLYSGVHLFAGLNCTTLPSGRCLKLTTKLQAARFFLQWSRCCVQLITQANRLMHPI